MDPLPSQKKKKEEEEKLFKVPAIDITSSTASAAASWVGLDTAAGASGEFGAGAGDLAVGDGVLADGDTADSVGGDGSFTGSPIIVVVVVVVVVNGG